MYGSLRDHKFIYKEWLDMNKIFSFPRYTCYSLDDIDAILYESHKLAKEVVAPTNDENDNPGAILKDGKVYVPEGMKKAYWAFEEAGWGACNYDHNYEGALPRSLFTAVTEYFGAANPGMGPYLLAGCGAAELIQTFGSEEVQKRFLPKMFSGEWAGTMDLTEPIGGSDVGELLTKATATETPGVYKIKGSKCFISGGDQDITDNIIHLTLARVEGARPGTGGISLFVVPKYWVNEDQSMSEFNDVNCVSIEHKMGIRGSATCVLAFGEENGCRGWILGNPPGEDGKGEGMAQMFNMMNEERMNTGLAAMAASTSAYYNSVKYATERIQGRLLTDPKAGRVPIIKHEDIKRMLLDQKAHIEAMRALVVRSYYLMDIAENSADPEEKKQASFRLEVQTPLVKAYCSDMAWILTAEAMQVYGGYGYSEENPVAQICRDVKIYSIWEGTNYIQSLDLVGRKWMMAKGQAFNTWMSDIEKLVADNEAHEEFAREVGILKQAIADYRGIQMALGGYLGSGKMSYLGVYATRILHATAKLGCGYLILDQALIAAAKIKELGTDHFDYAFYKGKVEAAKYYVRNIVPEVGDFAAKIKAGDDSILEIPEEAFFV